MGGWADGRIGGSVDGWMGGWVDGWMGGADVWMGGWVDGWMGDGRMDGWTDGRMDGRMDGWTDGGMSVCMSSGVCLYVSVLLCHVLLCSGLYLGGCSRQVFLCIELVQMRQALIASAG